MYGNKLGLCVVFFFFFRIPPLSDFNLPALTDGHVAPTG